MPPRHRPRLWGIIPSIISCIISNSLIGSAESDLDPNIGFGPLRIASQSPGQSLRLGLIPRTPSNLRAQQLEIYASGTWVNVWADTPDIQLDYESLTNELVVTYGLDNDWQIEGGIVVRSTFGGYMDVFIQDFHRSLGMDLGGRDRVDKDRANIRIAPSQSQPGLSLDNQQLQGHSDLHGEVTLQRTCLRGTGALPSIAIAMTARIPLDDVTSHDDGEVDIGINGAIAKRLGCINAYATCAYTRFGTDRLQGVRLHRSNWSGLSAVEYRANPKWSLFMQYLVSQALAPDYHDLSKPSHELTCGTKFAIQEGMVVEVGLIENLFVFSNSPDFGVHLGMCWRM